MLTAAMFLVFSLATQGLCVSISNIQLSPASPSALSFNQHVDITFSYSTEESGGVRIFARPFTNGSLTPNYAAHGSPLHPVGSGSGTGYFTITAGDTTVDQIRFEVLNADQSQLLFEFFVPVEYRFPIAFVGLPEEPILSVSTSGRIVTISWTSIPNAEGYTLAYAPHPGLDYIGTLDMGTQTNAAFDFVAGNAAYYLAVLPYNANGNGTLSNIETFQIP